MEEMKHENEEMEVKSQNNLKESDMEEKKKHLNKGVIIGGICLIVVILAAVGITNAIKLKKINDQYIKAEQLCDNQEYDQALEIYLKLGNYKDAVDKIKEVHYLKAEKLYEENNFLEAAEEYRNASDYKDANEKSNGSIYKYAKKMAKSCDYENAALYMKKIDYKDSKECGERYDRITKERFFDGAFHYSGVEFSVIMNQNLKKMDANYSAKVENQNEKGTLIEIQYAGKDTSAHVMLTDMNDEIPEIKNITYLWEDIGDQTNNSVELWAAVYCIQLTNPSMTFDEAKNIMSNALSLGTNQQTVNGVIYAGASDGKGLAIEIYAENDDQVNETEKTSGSNLESPVYTAYYQAGHLKLDALKKTATGNYQYNGITINSEEVESSLGQEYLNQGALYRSCAKKLEGFYVLGESLYGNWKENVAAIFNFAAPTTWEEMKPFVDDVSTFISQEGKNGVTILRRLAESSYVSGEIDADNLHCNITISDLSGLANELHVNEAMLGYIIAEFDEYAAQVEFDGNTCSIGL